MGKRVCTDSDKCRARVPGYLAGTSESWRCSSTQRIGAGAHDPVSVRSTVTYADFGQVLGQCLEAEAAAISRSKSS